VTTYAIGDVQGCYRTLQRLLEAIRFDAEADRLWFVGDLVNRGPASLATLRFVHSLGNRAITVLGNHDLHLLAVYYAGHSLKSADTLDEVLVAPDSEELMTWLRQRPILHRDDALGYVMCHAGLPHIWSLAEAEQHARELESVLRGPKHLRYFKKMYGNKPKRWREELEGRKRLRAITNYFTRMRVIDERGTLDLEYKGDLEQLPAHGFPWYNAYAGRSLELEIIFGHWAALDGLIEVPGIHALDTGCVWGNGLTALCLETRERTFIASV
jgi:bis(5'-nucleosyl)-tetraphosphatase (symmetrical)